VLLLVPQTRRSARITCLLFCCAFVACFPPEGPPPDAEPGRTVNGAFDPRGFAPQNALEALDLPEKPPFSAWTRTAPLSLVDESGAHVTLLSGHGTRVEVTHLLKARALVRCTGCETPAEGWLQREVLRPADLPDPSPHAVLSEHIRRYRAELDATAEGSEQIRALDGGCVVLQEDPGTNTEAVCPAAASRPSYEGPRVTWMRTADGWVRASTPTK